MPTGLRKFQATNPFSLYVHIPVSKHSEAYALFSHLRAIYNYCEKKPPLEQAEDEPVLAHAHGFGRRYAGQARHGHDIAG